MFQGQAVEELHGVERLVLLADVVNRADIGVVKCERSLALR
jgi:hypothetical protein